MIDAAELFVSRDGSCSTGRVHMTGLMSIEHVMFLKHFMMCRLSHIHFSNSEQISTHVFLDVFQHLGWGSPFPVGMVSSSRAGSKKLGP